MTIFRPHLYSDVILKSSQLIDINSLNNPYIFVKKSYSVNDYLIHREIFHILDFK